MTVTCGLTVAARAAVTAVLFLISRRFPDLKPTGAELRNGVRPSVGTTCVDAVHARIDGGDDIRTARPHNAAARISRGAIRKDHKREHCEVLGGLRRKAGNGEVKMRACAMVHAKTDVGDMAHAAAWSDAADAPPTARTTKMWSHEAAIYADPSKKRRAQARPQPALRQGTGRGSASLAPIVGVGWRRRGFV